MPCLDPHPAGPSSTEDSASANDEIIRDRLLRELTQEYASLLKEMATRTLGGPGAGGGPGSGGPGSGGGGSPPGGGSQGAAGSQAGGAGGGKSALEWLLETDAPTGFQAVQTAVEGMRWRDEAAFRFAQLAKAVVGMAPRDPRLYAYVGGQVLQAAVSSLATEVRAGPGRGGVSKAAWCLGSCRTRHGSSRAPWVGRGGSCGRPPAHGWPRPAEIKLRPPRPSLPSPACPNRQWPRTRPTSWPSSATSCCSS